MEINMVETRKWIKSTICEVMPKLPKEEQVYVMGYMAGLAAAAALRTEQEKEAAS